MLKSRSDTLEKMFWLPWCRGLAHRGMRAEYLTPWGSQGDASLLTSVVRSWAALRRRDLRQWTRLCRPHDGQSADLTRMHPTLPSPSIGVERLRVTPRDAPGGDRHRRSICEAVCRAGGWVGGV